MRLITGLAAAALATGAVAEPVGEWVCAEGPAQIFDFAFESSGLRVNNILLAERTDSAGGAPVISVAASTANRSDKPGYASVEVVGRGGSSPAAFALNASTILGLSSGRSEEVRDAVFSAPGALAGATDICVRVQVALKN